MSPAISIVPMFVCCYGMRCSSSTRKFIAPIWCRLIRHTYYYDMTDIEYIFFFAGHNAHRSKREIVSFTTSNDYTMEVLVAVDSKMVEYHGDNMNSYVLILMSIVSSIYLDPTIGNAIKVAVVHILMIHEDVNIKEIRAGAEGCLFRCHACLPGAAYPFFSSNLFIYVCMFTLLAIFRRSVGLCFAGQILSHHSTAHVPPWHRSSSD